MELSQLSGISIDLPLSERIDRVKGVVGEITLASEDKQMSVARLGESVLDQADLTGAIATIEKFAAAWFENDENNYLRDELRHSIRWLELIRDNTGIEYKDGADCNYHLLGFASIRFARETIIWSSNQEFVNSRPHPTLPPEDVGNLGQHWLHASEALSVLRRNTSLQTVRESAARIGQERIGNCREFSILIANYIREQGKPVSIVKVCNGDHALNQIGRKWKWLVDGWGLKLYRREEHALKTMAYRPSPKLKAKSLDELRPLLQAWNSRYFSLVKVTYHMEKPPRDLGAQPPPILRRRRKKRKPFQPLLNLLENASPDVPEGSFSQAPPNNGSEGSPDEQD